MIDEGIALIQDDASARGRRCRLIDERQRLFDRKGVNACDEIDVLLSMREQPRLVDAAAAEEVRVVYWPGNRGILARHSAIEQRQLRINAGDRALGSGGPSHAQRNTLGKHEIENSILQVLADERGCNWRFYRGQIRQSINGFIGRRFDPNDVVRRQRVLACVVIANPLRAVAVLVDDDRDVFGRLRVSWRDTPWTDAPPKREQERTTSGKS